MGVVGTEFPLPPVEFNKDGVNSGLGSALLCGLVCPFLPFLGPLLSLALTYSSAASQTSPAV